MHFGGGIGKKGGRQNVQKWMGKQKGGGGEEGGGWVNQDLLKKLEEGTFLGGHCGVGDRF